MEENRKRHGGWVEEKEDMREEEETDMENEG